MAKKFCLGTILTTFVLLLLGGLVHNTESSLACPDWPLCYGQVFPKMEGGVLIEHSHRLLATLVGFLVTLMVIITGKSKNENGTGPENRENRYEQYSLAKILLGMVILQGILGGITVLYKLPTIVSTTHLGLSMVFFSTLILLHHKLSYANEDLNEYRNKHEINYSVSLRHGVLCAMALVCAQMILGAFMRHTGVGASCGTGAGAAFFCVDSELWSRSLWPSSAPSQLHMSHRLMAVFVGLVVMHFSVKALLWVKRNPIVPSVVRKKLVFWSIFSLCALIGQMILGVLTVVSGLGIISTTLHLGGAALCLAGLWKLNLHFLEVEKTLLPQGGHSLLSDLVGLTKPKLSALVICTTLIGLVMAPGEIYFFKALAALIFISMLVGGAGALNCYIERDIDGRMERTKNRSLPAGRLGPKWALCFGLVMMGISIPGLAFWANPTTGFLGAVATLLYLFAYTPLKEKSPMAVYVGAIPGAIPPLMGHTTVTGHMDGPGLALFLILFVWQLPHFMAISIYHNADYQKANLKVYGNARGLSFINSAIFLFTLALFFVSLIPAFMGAATDAYKNAAIVFSGAFTFLALEGFFKKNECSHRGWARRYFLGSVFYLPALLCAMVFFQ